MNRSAANTVAVAAAVTLAVLLGSAVAPAHAAAVTRQSASEKMALDAVSGALKKAEEAESLFGQQKWADALAAFDEADKQFDRAFKRFPQTENFGATIGPREFPAARKYGFVITENARFAFQRYGTIFANNVLVVPVAGGNVSVSDLRKTWRDMRRVALVFSGKAVPFNGNGTDEPNEVDVKDFVQNPFGVAADIELPVPDDQWEGVVALLRRCALMVEAALAADPKLAGETVGDGNGHLAPGADAKKKVLALLAEAEAEYKPAETRLAAEVPANVQNDLNRVLGDLNLVLERVNNGSYYDVGDAGLVGGHGRAAYLANARKIYGEMYAKEAKTLPADVLKPLTDKIAEINAVIDRKAPGYTFEAKVPAPAGIAATVKAAVAKHYAGAQIARVALDGAAWNTYRTDLGVITGRGRDGRILFKMPGEKWSRSLLFTYIADYVGGGKYSSSGRVGLGNVTRFESGK